MRLGTTANGKPAHPLAVERAKQGLTVRALAAAVDMSPAAVSHIETGRSQPHRSTKRLLARELGVKVSDLWPSP